MATDRTRWTPAEVIRRGREVLANQGVAALGYKVLGELCYRRVYVYEDDFTHELDLPMARIPLAVKRLDHRDAPAYLEAAPGTSPDEFQRRLDAGHHCLGGWTGGRLAGYVWSGSGRVRIDYLGVDIEVPGDTIYGYEVVVREEFRRLRVSAGLIRERRSILRGYGYRHAVTVVMPENLPAQAFQRAVKRPKTGTLSVIRLGPWSRTWLKASAPISATLAQCRFAC